MVSLEIKNLAKTFGQVIAVKDLSIQVKDKELVVFLGPSGCGKTTTLRCIAGLEKPEEGEIYIGDTLVNDLTPRERNVAMVFQSYALYSTMTVYKNIAFPLRMRKTPEKEIDEHVKKTAQLLQISDLLNRKPGELSGGQAQRVALGRAIVRNPNVFLMDEPLSNLDAKLRVHMRVELKKLQQELGVTTVYVTHDQVEAMTMGDKVLLLNKGEKQQYGTSRELYDRPANLCCAGFLGSPAMNFIKCSLIEKDNSIYLDGGEFEFRPGKDITDIILENVKESELIIGIRPEHISIHLSRVRNSYESEVVFPEYIGNETIFNVRMGKDTLKIRTPLMSSAKPSDKIWLTFDENKIHIFDGKTERALV